jgi:hypothetical protein
VRRRIAGPWITTRSGDCSLRTATRTSASATTTGIRTRDDEHGATWMELDATQMVRQCREWYRTLVDWRGAASPPSHSSVVGYDVEEIVASCPSCCVRAEGA